MKLNTLLFLLMLVFVPLAGELNIHPFANTFRLSFGTPVFFFFLLSIRHIAPALSGVLAGIAVVAFRILLNHYTQSSLLFEELLILHGPTFFYYMVYGLLFQLLNINAEPYRALRVGILSVGIEVAASVSELSVRWSIDGDFWDIIKISKVAFMAMIRSFFVLGFYNMIRLNQSVQHEEAQRQQTERILLLVSDLYEESVQLGKTLSHAEQITRESYELYRELQQDESLKDREHYARQALRISGQVHEIKKDSQRIFAGLSKLIDAESGVHYMASQELGELIIRTNSKYAQSLDKSIRFTLDVDPLLPKLHVYTVLTLINNLTANAVEAMRDDGRIDVSIRCLPGKEDIASFSVTDNGPGIPQRKREMVFTPGYTTKYDEEGQPSTGMGLFYVREVAESLEGTIELQQIEEENTDRLQTTFRITLPLRKLTEKGR
ncbi:sensor histidine kinase [Paenibacillus sp. FSL L8-0644]|uniref:sensor histidine kinase n=1 Tax=Paenibacillus sp. FSL L8-0644 TaxID=2954523 RepID=UPI0030FB5E12